MDTKQLYENKPDELSSAFMEFLTANNIVVYVSDHFLGIQNCKYGEDHLTFFSYKPRKYLHQLSTDELINISDINRHYPDYFFYINADIDRSIQRFHFHLVKDRTSLITHF